MNLCQPIARLEHERKEDARRRWSRRWAFSQGSHYDSNDQNFQSIVRGAEAAAVKVEKEEPLAEATLMKPDASVRESDSNRNLSISLRASFSCFRISFIDSCPAEVLVLTMENFNALATWDLLRRSDSTVYITLADLQVDNMVPNVPFPVAVSRLNSQSSTTGENISPLLVVGASIAPRHSSGIAVSSYAIVSNACSWCS